MSLTPAGMCTVVSFVFSNAPIPKAVTRSPSVTASSAERRNAPRPIIGTLTFKVLIVVLFSNAAVETEVTAYFLALYSMVSGSSTSGLPVYAWLLPTTTVSPSLLMV